MINSIHTKKYFILFCLILFNIVLAGTPIINTLIQPGDLVFDVGANIGNKTNLYLRQGAKVICFEPQPQCINTLNDKFSCDPNVIIINKGLAAEEGDMKLMICNNAHTLTTFSTDWKKGRFSNYKWDKEIIVPVTTLNKMIEKYGLPQFCKIDVEGFEYDVLQGLTYPIPHISFEFAKEFLNKTIQCIKHLSNLGYTKFNIAIGEKENFSFNTWVDQKSIINMITSSKEPLLWGDIYAKFN